MVSQQDEKCTVCGRSTETTWYYCKSCGAPLLAENCHADARVKPGTHHQESKGYPALLNFVIWYIGTWKSLFGGKGSSSIGSFFGTIFLLVAVIGWRDFSNWYTLILLVVGLFMLGLGYDNFKHKKNDLKSSQSSDN